MPVEHSVEMGLQYRSDQKSAGSCGEVWAPTPCEPAEPPICHAMIALQQIPEATAAAFHRQVSPLKKYGDWHRTSATSLRQTPTGRRRTTATGRHGLEPAHDGGAEPGPRHAQRSMPPRTLAAELACVVDMRLFQPGVAGRRGELSGRPRRVVSASG